MSTELEDYISLTGRVFLSVIFIQSGMGKVGNFEGTVGYMSAHGMPMAPIFLFGAISFLLLGGLSLLSGYKIKYGVLMLLIFIVPATFIFHAFWAVPEEMVKIQTIMFTKNIAIIGGLLSVLAHGAGRFSLDKKSD